MPRVLVTGFTKWGNEPGNPTEELAKRLDGSTVLGAEVVGKVLPVSFKRAGSIVEQLVRELRPSVVISFGLAPKDQVIRVERVAVNIMAPKKPDEDGYRPVDEPIDPSGPVAYFSTIPTRKIYEELLRRGIPARLSYSAGTFLCNFVMYKFLRELDILGMNSLSGFIHVPFTPELAAKKDPPAASLPMELMEEAARIAIELSLKEIG